MKFVVETGLPQGIFYRKTMASPKIPYVWVTFGDHSGNHRFCATGVVDEEAGEIHFWPDSIERFIPMPENGEVVVPR